MARSCCRCSACVVRAVHLGGAETNGDVNVDGRREQSEPRARKRAAKMMSPAQAKFSSMILSADT